MSKGKTPASPAVPKTEGPKEEFFRIIRHSMYDYELQTVLVDTSENVPKTEGNNDIRSIVLRRLNQKLAE